jgi:hypothetical protein
MTALPIEPGTPAPPRPSLQLVPPRPPSVHELGQLRLLDLQARYIQLVSDGRRDRSAVMASVQDMSRDELIAHIVEGRP